MKVHEDGPRKPANIVFAIGGVVYAVAIVASLVWYSVGGADSDRPFIGLITLPIILPLLLVVMIPSTFFFATLIGLPPISFTYGLSTIKRNPQEVVGYILLVSVLIVVAILSWGIFQATPQLASIPILQPVTVPPPVMSGALMPTSPARATEPAPQYFTDEEVFGPSAAPEQAPLSFDDIGVEAQPAQPKAAPTAPTPKATQETPEVQSKLPPCPSGQNTYRNNCFGTWAANGYKYVGEFKDGKFNGQGTFTSDNGNIYVGEFKGGAINGHGTMTLANGKKYVGEFKDGKFNGQGTFTYANGDKYVGEWKDAKENGRGTLTLANGKKYVGEFKDDERNGQGTFTFPGGNYIGEFKDDKYNGHGTYTYANGEKYVGKFKDGMYNGQGTYTFPDGEKYVGEFKDGKFNGNGKEFAGNGMVSREGYWIAGSYIGPKPPEHP